MSVNCFQVVGGFVCFASCALTRSRILAWLSSGSGSILNSWPLASAIFRGASVVTRSLLNTRVNCVKLSVELVGYARFTSTKVNSALTMDLLPTATSAKATTAKFAVKDAQRGARTLIPLRVSATDYLTLLEKLSTHSQKKKETQEVHELQEVYEMDVLEVAEVAGAPDKSAKSDAIHAS